MKPEVTVIIPTYGSNTEPCRAIDSALAQENVVVEVIVVDDNGRGTKQQLTNEELFHRYDDESRFHYIVHERNMNGSAARNTGIKAANGVFLCFLDDDDELADPYKLSVQFREGVNLDSTWAGTYSSCDIYHGDTYVHTTKAEQSGILLKPYMLDDLRIETAAPVIRRDAVLSIGGFDASFVRHQDWEFFARLLDVYKLKAVCQVTYRRIYKLGVGKRSAENRLILMDKYTNTMRSCIKSLDEQTLMSVIRKKYIQIVYAFLGEKRFARAWAVIKQHKYPINECILMFWGGIRYLIRRMIYGSHY